MALTALRAGATINAATPDEVREIIQQENTRLAADARANKRIEVVFPVQPAAAAVFLGQPQSIGPDEGYVWSLKLLSAVLSAAGSIAVYKSSSSLDRRRPLEQIAAQTVAGIITATVTWSSDAARLRHGEGLFIESGVTITGLYLAGWEVPAEKEVEVYD